MLRARRLGRWLVLALACATPAVAHADSTEDLTAAIRSYELDARKLATDLPTPTSAAVPNPNRLVDAQVAYATGDYEAASSALFDLVNAKGPDAEVATYYLAETLFQKQDRGAARTYFTQLVDRGVLGKYYQIALGRLIELAIAQHDTTGVDVWLAAFDKVPADQRKPFVPYIRGKYAFAQSQFPEALANFRDVPKGSEFELQALYYTGAVDIATKDLAKATEVFTELVGRKPHTANDRRVIELSQLALGRLYYERDEPSKSIDAYLLVDRRSDLFRDALYEVGWVYVKGKQYDKALRVLELLSESEPTSVRTPTVRILEGNLRIRKAQAINAAEANGIHNADADAEVEYAKATQVFAATHDAFFPAYQALTAMIANKTDPAQLLAQIAGHSQRAFSISVPLPDAAGDWLRDEPDVQRAVSLENDVADITSDLSDAVLGIARLEGALASPNHTRLFPAVAARRTRAEEIEDKLVKIRNGLADQQLALLNGGGGDLAAINGQRLALAQQYAAMPDPRRTYADHLAQDQKEFDASEQAAADVASTINAAGATAVALRMYQGPTAAPLTPAQKTAINTELDAIGHDADAIARELRAARNEIDLGHDLVGGNDDTVSRTRAMRRQVRAAQDAESHALAAQATASRDQARSQVLISLDGRAALIADGLDALENQLDQLTETGIAQVQTEIASDNAEIAALETELAGAQGEARDAGASVLGASFAGVKDKLYDVVIRSDVGTIDVDWSQKEDADEGLKRLNLQRQREVKQLHDEFRDILDDHVAKPAAKKPQANMPPPISSGSTDHQDPGANGGRIKPIEDTTTEPAAPDVKPDATKTTPKKGGSK